MKILTVISYFNNSYGGVQKTAQILANNFKDNNHESKVFITEDKFKEKDLKNIKPFFQHIELYFQDHQDIIYKWSPDIIVFIDHAITYNNVKNLINLRSAWKLCFSIWGLPTKISESSDHLMLLSDWSHLLYKNKGGRNKKISLIGIPFDLDEIKNVFKESIKNKYYKKSRCITLGRIGQPAEGSWSKYLIEIFEDLYELNSEIKLVLIGAPNSTIRRVKKSYLKSKIKILEPNKDRKEIFKLHSSIDIFIHISSFGETFGKVILESLSTGAHAVVLNTPWASIGHKFYKYQDSNLVHVNNLKNMKKALIKVINKLNSENQKRNLKLEYIKPYSGENTVKEILKNYRLRHKNIELQNTNRFKIIKSLDRSFDRLNLFSRIHIIIFGLSFRYLHRIYCGFRKIDINFKKNFSR